jgi:hypothetical protein
MSDLLPNRSLDLRDRGGLIFYEDEHSYFNADGVKYTGMTTFLKKFEGSGFDADGISKYKAIKESLPTDVFTKVKKRAGGWQNVKNYYDIICNKNEQLAKLINNKRLEILGEWEQATINGSLEHDKREKEIIENGLTWNGKYYPYMNKTILDVTKEDVCVIPEIMLWCHDKKLCGLADLPVFDKGVCHILDYKTNKKIEHKGFMGKKMRGAFALHPDCNFSKYSGQLYGYQKMACDLTGFEPGECWIISTANDEYKRKQDIFIKCADMTKEIDAAFKSIIV